MASGEACTLTLLTRAYCHLCDDMLAALRPFAAELGVTLTVIDIDGEPALEAAYGECVPVLLEGDAANGVELCRYRFDRERVRAALGARARR